MAHMLFGVKTTSGLRHVRSAWRRSRWKYCAAVRGWQIWKLSRPRVAETARRALECPVPGLRSRGQEQDDA